MACTKYHKLINEFIDNEISKKEEISLLEHISYCENCKIHLSNWSKIKSNIKLSFSDKQNYKDIDLSKQIMSKIHTKTDLNTFKSKTNLLYKIATFILIASAILIMKQLKNNHKDFALKEEEQMVFEHLEKSHDTQVINVAFSQER